MVLAVLAVLAAVVTVYTVKWLKRPREERERDMMFQPESNRVLDTMTFNSYQTDEESADESDGLLAKRVTAAKPTSNSRNRFDENS